jgi:uncharacterized Fe-S center protein
MKTITLKEAIHILENCSAIITDNCVTYPSVYEGEDEFLTISWSDGYDDFSDSFQEADNQTIKIVGSSMFLTDSDGDDYQITILGPQNLEQL